jgi:hypothetical protein
MVLNEELVRVVSGEILGWTGHLARMWEAKNIFLLTRYSGWGHRTFFPHFTGLLNHGEINFLM